jgi:hypothetical protein
VSCETTTRSTIPDDRSGHPPIEALNSVVRSDNALVDPDALTAWLPPNGMTGRFERFDARPGGSYRLVLTYADPS